MRKYFSGLLLLIIAFGCSTNTPETKNGSTFHPGINESKPMVFWYWNDAAVSKEGITTDLEAMKKAGLEGAYLFFIRGASDRVPYDDPAVQFTPHWWELVKFAFSEARRLDLKLGLHSCDGFTLAGGPWITPELSMQKVVWSDTIVEGGQPFSAALAQPETNENYYEDLRIFAYPTPEKAGVSSFDLDVKVTASAEDPAPAYLNQRGNRKGYRSYDPCWVQYEFPEPFTCRSIVLSRSNNNLQANRLIIEVSDDGKKFRKHTRLEPHRQGWTDMDYNVTQAIEPVTAKYFRFVYDPSETEPGSEDLDAGKWKQALRLHIIELSSDPKIHQYEGKNGSVWRVAAETTEKELPGNLCVPKDRLIDITQFFTDGRLEWKVPAGKWTILRMGHTSTGKTNYIGGGALGLEADKLNPKAAELQFDRWLGEFYRQIGENETSGVLKYFHSDSWECGSQNWSPVFAKEFQKRRGYDLMPYLPVFAGVAINDAAFSEKVLRDVRTTISELVTDNFYGTMQNLSAEKGLLFSAESVAPVAVADGMLHQKNVDIPMGEFWLNSPTHDKPNDILDAVSAAHIYGKKLVQSESFTEIRLDWDEYPGMLKTLADRNLALGINRIVFHVFSHNPWVDRKPGMTLGVVGLFFQPTQTWFEPGKAWLDYLNNCQTLLQKGDPVTDIAVFTGEEIPRRALTPDRLMDVIPGIFGEEKVKEEQVRRKNEGNPSWQKPAGITCGQNIYDPENWTDPLRGYAYDSFNKDALLNLASVKDGKVVLPGGAGYSLFIVPGKRRMNPEGNRMSLQVAKKILQLINDGATVLIQHKPEKSLNYDDDPEEFAAVIDQLFTEKGTSISENVKVSRIGKGRIIYGTFDQDSFDELGLNRDFYAEENGKLSTKLAWNHRSEKGKEIYFISNQDEQKRKLELSFRLNGKIPEIYFPVSDEIVECRNWRVENGRTIIPVSVNENESFFVIFEKDNVETGEHTESNREELSFVKEIEGPWTVQFDPKYGGPEKPVIFNELSAWETNNDERIKYYSGTAVYQKSFEWAGSDGRVWLDVGKVDNLAEVFVNGKSCGVAWTAPFRVEISHALQPGENKLEIAVTNTWANRLMGDHQLPEKQQITWTTCAYRLEGKKLLPAGLIGPVLIKETVHQFHSLH